MAILLASCVTAFLLSFVIIPVVIKYSLQKNLGDSPGRRKVHKKITPSMGGLAIFIGFLIPTLIWMPLPVVIAAPVCNWLTGVGWSGMLSGKRRLGVKSTNPNCLIVRGVLFAAPQLVVGSVVAVAPGAVAVALGAGVVVEPGVLARVDVAAAAWFW